MTWGMIGGAAVSVVGGALLSGGGGGGSQQSGTQTVTQQQQLDPRITNTIFGSGARTLRPGVVPQYGETGQMLNPDSDFSTDSGLLGRFQGYFDQPQNPLMQQFGQTNQQYLATHGGQDMEAMRTAAGGLLTGIQAPQMGAASVRQQNPMQSAGMQAPTNMLASNVMPTRDMSVASMSAPASMTAAQAGAAQMEAARTEAPGQNNISLAPAYQDMVYGAPGANPFLTGAIQGGINQSSNAFGNMLTSATRNLTENVLPTIRSGARASGSYGGNREGLAQGKALDTFNTQIGQAATQFGQHNTDAAVGAQAGAYDADRSRALSAMSGLGAQQYGVASQDAGFKQQANLTNATFQQQAAQANADRIQQANSISYGGLLDAARTNAGFQQQGNAATFDAAQTNARQNSSQQQQANATNYGGLLDAARTNSGYAQDTNRINYAGGMAVDQANAGFQQGANQSNIQSQLGTNGLNSANTQSGIGALGGLLSTAYGAGQNQDAYALNQAGRVNSLITPYLGVNGSSTTTQPLYENRTGNMLAGATAGLGLYRGITGLMGNDSSTIAPGTPGTYFDGQSWVRW